MSDYSLRMSYAHWALFMKHEQNEFLCMKIHFIQNKQNEFVSKLSGKTFMHKILINCDHLCVHFHSKAWGCTIF